MKYLLVALAVTALVVSAELDGTSTLDAFLEDDISMYVGQGAAAGKKNIGLNLEFKCGGWHHKIQCTISCVEEFDTPRWIWNATDVGGLGGMRHWEYVKEEGYVSRCNLKALLGPECVKHVRACFLKKWGRQCPFADARTPVQLRVLQNRFLLRTGQTGNAANDVLSVQGMNPHRWNLILTNRPGSPFSTNIQNRDRNQGRVGRGRGLNSASSALDDLDAQELDDADMLPPARHMAEGELRMWKRVQRANGNFIYHKCPSHHKVKAGAGAKKHEAELDTDLQLEDSALYGGGSCA